MHNRGLRFSFDNGNVRFFTGIRFLPGEISPDAMDVLGVVSGHHILVIRSLSDNTSRSLFPHAIHNGHAILTVHDRLQLRN